MLPSSKKRIPELHTNLFNSHLKQSPYSASLFHVLLWNMPAYFSYRFVRNLDEESDACITNCWAAYLPCDWGCYDYQSRQNVVHHRGIHVLYCAAAERIYSEYLCSGREKKTFLQILVCPEQPNTWEIKLERLGKQAVESSYESHEKMQAAEDNSIGIWDMTTTCSLNPTSSDDCLVRECFLWVLQFNKIATLG